MEPSVITITAWVGGRKIVCEDMGGQGLRVGDGGDVRFHLTGWDETTECSCDVPLCEVMSYLDGACEGNVCPCE